MGGLMTGAMTGNDPQGGVPSGPGGGGGGGGIEALLQA